MPEPKLTVERETPYYHEAGQLEYKDGRYEYTGPQADANMAEKKEVEKQ